MSVILAGAGCGGLQQLTLGVYEALQKADVILYDDLISEDIRHMETKAIWEYCGKRKGRHSLSQEDINDRLLVLANQYEHVVRLKGGDPFVFGRGMEEKRFLESHGVKVRVLAGISSVYGVPQRAGIPVTDRMYSSMFTAVTASRKADGRVFEQDAEQLARLSGTLVVLMGFSVREKIAQELIGHGKDPDTPAAILSSRDISHTRVETGKLWELGNIGKTLSTPAIIVIGDVVRNYEPEITVGFTGTADFTDRVMEEMPDMSAIQLVTRTAVPQNFELLPAGWYVFASRGGAKQFLASIKKKRTDVRTLPKIAVIGQGTAEIFQEAGIFPDLIAGSSTDSLGTLLEETAEEGDSIITFRCKAADDSLEQKLSRKFHVKRTDLYDMDVTINDTSQPDYVVFGSKLAAKTVTCGKTAVAISAGTASAITGFERVIIADEPSARGVARAIENDSSR